MLHIESRSDDITENQHESIKHSMHIESRSDDITENFFAFQRFGYHVSVEHDEKHPQPKFGGNRFMGARDMAA